MPPTDRPYASRGGEKLAAALDTFALDVTGETAADLGASTGGFTDCLLRRGARRVFAVDTAYGQLAWTLRQDPRVVVIERSNALHLDPTERDDFAGCDLVTIDLGWTRQVHAIPAALRWLRRDADPGRIVTLIKPHYEAGEGQAQRRKRRSLVLDDQQAEAVVQQVLDGLPGLGVAVDGCVESPIRGGKGRGRQGNREWLALLRPAGAIPGS